MWAYAGNQEERIGEAKLAVWRSLHRRLKGIAPGGSIYRAYRRSDYFTAGSQQILFPRLPGHVHDPYEQAPAWGWVLLIVP